MIAPARRAPGLAAERLLPAGDLDGECDVGSFESNVWEHVSVTTPPDGRPVYGLLAGPEDESSCRRVSDALALGTDFTTGLP